MRRVILLVPLLAACGRAPEVEPLPAALLAPAEGVGEVPEAREFSGEPLRVQAHDGPLTDLAFVGTELLATVSYDDRTIKLWNLEDGSPAGEARHDRRFHSLAALPDGSGLLTTDAYGYLVFWPVTDQGLGAPRPLNPSDGKGAIDGVESRLGHHARVAVSPNGKVAATSSYDALVTVWDLPGRKELRRISTGRKSRSIAFSPDGRGVAVGGIDNTWTWWDLASGASGTREISKVSATSDVSGLAFSRDGKRLATGHMDSSLTLWDPAAPKELKNWFVKGASIFKVAFTPDGRLAAAEASGKVSLWGPDAAKAGELEAFDSSVLSLAVSPDGARLAAGSDKGALVIFR